jgi:dienelactone hydrolase
MRVRVAFTRLSGLVLALFCITTLAATDDCRRNAVPSISFVQFQVPNLAGPTPLNVKGKLSLPTPGKKEGVLCVNANRKWPAVLILHGSAGVDSRGDFYEEALNDAGIATLQIDMWEARGVSGLLNRPAAPILTYPDAFAALAFLTAHPNIEAGNIGVLGFSWGGAISLASAERLYVDLFGGGLTFKAHVANYPVCYGANNTSIPALFPPAEKGTQILNLTGAPVMIQIGSNDDYDNGTQHCRALAAAINPTNNNVVQVVEYPGAYHAWDRLMIPVTALDPFGNEGSFFRTGVLPPVRIVPDVELAYESRARVVRFFRQHLR